MMIMSATNADKQKTDDSIQLFILQMLWSSCSFSKQQEPRLHLPEHSVQAVHSRWQIQTEINMGHAIVYNFGLHTGKDIKK